MRVQKTPINHITKKRTRVMTRVVTTEYMEGGCPDTMGSFTARSTPRRSTPTRRAGFDVRPLARKQGARLPRFTTPPAGTGTNGGRRLLFKKASGPGLVRMQMHEQSPRLLGRTPTCPLNPNRRVTESDPDRRHFHQGSNQHCTRSPCIPNRRATESDPGRRQPRRD